MGRLLTMYGIEASIKTAAEEETWAPLDDGFDNVAEALNETVQQYYFLKDKGFARNHVTGMAPAFTLTGRRVIGDPAQDFIFAAKYKLDSNRNGPAPLPMTAPFRWKSVLTVLLKFPLLPPFKIHLISRTHLSLY